MMSWSACLQRSETDKLEDCRELHHQLGRHQAARLADRADDAADAARMAGKADDAADLAASSSRRVDTATDTTRTAPSDFVAQRR